MTEAQKKMALKKEGNAPGDGAKMQVGGEPPKAGKSAKPTAKLAVKQPVGEAKLPGTTVVVNKATRSKIKARVAEILAQRETPTVNATNSRRKSTPELEKAPKSTGKVGDGKVKDGSKKALPKTKPTGPNKGPAMKPVASKQKDRNRSVPGGKPPKTPDEGSAAGRDGGKPALKKAIKQPSPLPETTEGKIPSREGKVFTRPWVMSDKLLAIANRTFPQYIISQKPGALHLHDHPYSALERAITEDIAVEVLERAGCESITDIGGNPSRHKAAGRRGIHSCCPLLSPGDVVRNARYTLDMDFCEELTEDCSKEADGYLAVHSIYYLEPSTVLALLHKSRKRIFVATAHKFTGGYGQMHHNGDYFESQFAIVAPDIVEMSVKGNDHGAYRHDPSFWLETNYFVEGDKAMAWGYRQHGDTYVYTFCPAPTTLACGVISRELSLFESARLDTHYGTVETGVDAYRPTVELLNITQTRVRSYGPLFWTTRKRQDIFVPKTIINRLATFMVGKPRNKDTLQMCIRETKKLVDEKHMIMAEGLRTLLCIHCPALAFLIHLDDEVAAFNSLLEPDRVEAYNELAHALAQEPRKLGLFESFCKRFASTERVIASYGTESVVGRGNPKIDDVDRSPSVLAAAISEAYNGDHELLTTVKAKAVGGFKFAATPAVAVLKDMRQRASVVIRGDEKPVKEGKTHIFQTSTVFADHAPICCAGTQHDDIVALRNRVVMAVPQSDTIYWAKMRERFLAERAVDTERMYIDFNEARSFTAWNQSFPPGKRVQQSKAYQDLLSRPLSKKDFLRNTFCKKEKAVKLHYADGLLSEFVPRAIQGATHHANVALGPFISQVSKGLARQWDGAGKFYYTSGATGVSVGAWLHNHYQPGDYLVDIDFTSYDGTQNRDTFAFTKAFYEDCGIAQFPNALAVLDSHVEIHGFTRNNVEYRVNDGMCSGNPDTSCSNSLVTGVSAEFGYYNYFGTTDGIFIAAMGDDNTAVIPQHLMRGRSADELKAHMIAHFYRLGFIAKVNVTDQLPKAEFCSGVFWPALVEGSETFVLGAKPGKQLTKIGYSLTAHPPSTVAGMMDGLKTAYAHVPLLWEYADIVRKKLPKHATEYHDPESRYRIVAGTKAVSRSESLAPFFEERYGLDLGVVTSSLRELLEGSDLDEMVHWTFLDVIVAIDA